MRIFRFSYLFLVTFYMQGMEPAYAKASAARQPPKGQDSPLLALPVELQQQILFHLTSARSLEEAAKNIRSWMQTSRAMRSLLNDPQVTASIIQQLAARFTYDGDQLMAAYVLGTDAAVDWIIQHHGTTSEQIRGLIYLAINTKAMPVAFKLIERFPENAKEEFSFLNPFSGRKQDTNFMIEALAQGNVSLIKKLFSIGFDPNKKNGDTPYLVWIMDRNSLEIVEAFLEAGADPNLPDKDGFTALMRAASFGNAPAVALLIRYGADPRLKDSWGNTALSRVQGELNRSEELLKRTDLDPAMIDNTREMARRYKAVVQMLQKNKIALRKNRSKGSSWKFT